MQESSIISKSKRSPKDKSKLGFMTIILITINSIIGTGIFFLPAIGARQAGLFSIVSWVIMSFIAIYFSMIFAELVGLYPKEGGIYEYAKVAFGTFPSFMLGWLTLIAANITIAMLMVGALKYIGPILPNAYLVAISIIFIGIFNFMTFKGLKTGVVMLIAFAFISLIAVFGIIIPGFIKFNPANFTGWFTHAGVSAAQSSGGTLGLLGLIFLTVFFIAETFFGWETTTVLAEKVRNPKKVMPKVMIIATIFIAVSSLLFVIASFSLINWQVLGQSVAPLADLAAVIYGSAAVPFYSILVYLAIIGSVAGWIVASPNLLLALAKDKLFIPQFAKLHPKTGTPYKAIIFQFILTSFLVFIGAGNFETLLHLLVPLVLFLYACVIVSLLVIRKKYKRDPHQYKAPLGTAGPIILIGITFALIMMWAFHSPDALHILGIIVSFIIIAIPIYLLLFFLYDPHSSIRFQDSFAGLSIFLERLFFPIWVQRHVLANAEITGKVVLELGASSGLLSKALSLRKPKKHIIIEQVKSLHNLIKRRMKDDDTVVLIYDEHLTSRIHPNVVMAEEVFSFGILGSLHNERVYLKHLAKIIPENSRVHFFDYIDLYKFLPNKELLSNLDRLKTIFKEAGFIVHIRKVKGLFWNYLIVDGIRSDKEGAVFV